MEAGVTDAANREITGRGRFLATYGTFRVNVEPVSYAVRAGDTAKFRVTTVDYDDKPVSTRVHVQLVFRHYAERQDADDSRARGRCDDRCHRPRRGFDLPSARRSTAARSSRRLRPRCSPARATPSTRAICGSWARAKSAGTQATATTQIVADKKTLCARRHRAPQHRLGDRRLLRAGDRRRDTRAEARGDALRRQDALVRPAHHRGLAAEHHGARRSSSRTTRSTRPTKVIQGSARTAAAASARSRRPRTSSSRSRAPPTTSSHATSQGKPVSADLSFGVVDEAIYSLYPD